METLSNDHESERRKSVWMRGLFMVIFMILLNVAVTVLAVVAIVQFFWLLFKSEKNQGLTDFGKSLSKWFRDVVRFQTVETNTKPFPWAAWPSEDDR
ncbi:MAG: DUF4389 domain-containing protein [Rhodobacteraceae bacterium]|nr:DUF4389 domain-containing protein [Paracoccaceae bacterium]